MRKTVGWTADQIPSQAGRRVLVTGANSGIGFETALQLARTGAEVLVPARTQAKTEDAVARIRRELPGAKVDSGLLDLADLQSVRAFAARAGEKPLDMLINNAGVMALPKRELTVDGFERQFATNFLGPFALTGLLLPALLATSSPRVVTVSSGVASNATIAFDNLQGEKKYSPMWGAYAQSKLADLMFAFELQRRSSLRGLRLTSTAAHPGYAVTNLQKKDQGFLVVLMTRILKPLASQNAEQGALPTLYAAVAGEPGGYYGPDGFQELNGYPRPAKVPEKARDVTVVKRLWSVAESLTGVGFEGLAG